MTLSDPLVEVALPSNVRVSGSNESQLGSGFRDEERNAEQARLDGFGEESMKELGSRPMLKVKSGETRTPGVKKSRLAEDTRAEGLEPFNS